jgi:hypothetical protein
MTQLALLPDPGPPLPRGYKRVEVYRGHTIATDPATPFGALFQVFDPDGQLIAQAQVSRWAARRLIEGESLSRI